MVAAGITGHVIVPLATGDRCSGSDVKVQDAIAHRASLIIVQDAICSHLQLVHGIFTRSNLTGAGAPVYCNDLFCAEIGAALDAAERGRLPKRRDLGVAVMQERLGDRTTNPDKGWGVRLVCAINMYFRGPPARLKGSLFPPPP